MSDADHCWELQSQAAKQVFHVYYPFERSMTGWIHGSNMIGHLSVDLLSSAYTGIYILYSTVRYTHMNNYIVEVHMDKYCMHNELTSLFYFLSSIVGRRQ